VLIQMPVVLDFLLILRGRPVVCDTPLFLVFTGSVTGKKPFFYPKDKKTVSPHKKSKDFSEP